MERPELALHEALPTRLVAQGYFVKLATGFHSHPKVVEAGLDGAGLFAMALAYCGDHLTDGRVPAKWVHFMDASEGEGSAAQRLVEVGLWRRDGEAYVIPDFLEWNTSKEEREGLSKARSEAGQRGARARWGDGKSDSKSHGKGNGKAGGKAMAEEEEEEEEENQQTDAAIAAVYARWRELLGAKGSPKRPTKKQAAHIRARLRDGFTAPELRRLIEALAASKWHRDQGFTDLHQVVGSAEKAEKWRQRAEPQARGPVAGDRRAWAEEHFPDEPWSRVVNARAMLETRKRRRGEGPATVEEVREELDAAASVR